MFVVAFFIIDKTWKGPRCPLVDEWINCEYNQTMDYFSALKRNELSGHEKTWRNLKCVLLSEGSQSEKTTWCMIPNPWHSGKGKTIETT